jgi:hypothetical protein
MIALVGGRGKQDEVAGVALQRLGELVILGLPNLAADLIGGQVMGFVEDDEVPSRRFENALYSRRSLQRVDAGDQTVVLGEGVS